MRQGTSQASESSSDKSAASAKPDDGHEASLLAQFEDRMRMVLEAARMCLWERDLVRNVVTYAQNVDAFVPSNVDVQIKSRDEFLQIVHPEDRERIQRELTDCEAKGTDHSCEYRLNPVDGEIRWIYETSRIFRDTQGQPRTIIGISADISERKRLEEALRRDQERFRGLVETTSDWVWEVNEDAVYTYASPKVYDLLGYQPSEILGKTPFDFMPPAEAERVRELFGKIVADASPFHRLENANLHRNGELVILETSGVPIFNNAGEFRGYRGIDRDITARKQMEKQERLHAEEITHAARLSLLGEMIATISHEINQPLYAISNFASACRTVIQSEGAAAIPKITDWIGQIHEQAMRAGEILRRLREFSRKRPFQQSQVDLNCVAQDARSLVESVISSQRIDLRLQIDGDLPRISGDSVQLQQVFVNLILNASEAFEEIPNLAARQIVISIKKIGKEILCRVEDNGPGLQPGAIDRIYEPFYTTKEGGLGLGLAVCRTIISHHGGRLWAEPNDGKGGAIFSFIIPLL